MSKQIVGGVIMITFNILLTNNVQSSTASKDVLIRNRRQLLWPNSTLLQFNVGVGTPSPAEKINVNWAFQANFQLPWNRSQIPMDIFEANSGYLGASRRKRDVNTQLHMVEIYGDYESDARLYHFYKYVEEILNGFGQNGASCVLQTLCLLGAQPLHSDHEDDLLHELATYVLNPTNDVAHGVSEEDDGYRYIQAYKFGENGRDCLEIYSSCKTPLVDMFTVLSS
ncbi:hypothetical protein O0L34_g15358 [Tuta absoluta]|nr:hypothetical protein O0L34_g15358 [Tuta absoluta]